MDKHLADNAQHVDNANEADQVMDDCLRNPVIVSKIFNHISSKELLQISLVNKLWMHEARSGVKNRGDFIANLSCDQQYSDNRCKTVIAFVSDLAQLGAIPVSGIKFDNNYHSRPHVCSFTRKKLDLIDTANLLDQLSLKSVSVNMGGPWVQFRNCPAFLLAKKVLQQFCGVLEELELSNSVEQGDYVDRVIQAFTFPRLKILKVTCNAPNEDIANYMRALLSRAPNLKYLHTNWNMNAVLHLLQGTSVEFVYTTTVRAPFDEISDDVISATRFERIYLEYTDSGFNFERFNRIAPILLQASRTSTIRCMSIDAVFAVPLMCYGTRFENVKVLWMDFGYDRLEIAEPRILNIVKNFDFTRIFPNLDKVYFVPNSSYIHGLPREHINAVIERANAVLVEPLLDRAARIKKLFLAFWYPRGAAAQFFVEMFPSVEKLAIKTIARRPISFGSIWKWLDLKELEVRGNVLPTTGNLDSVFCGIFPEEVEELRLKDDEYLKQVNIVPVMPAITCLRNLRTLLLHHEHFRKEPFGDDDDMFMFSKVTALLAFARQPGLAINLKFSTFIDPPAMTHLKPYVSVTCIFLRG